jgi:hypothetical protein
LEGQFLIDELTRNKGKSWLFRVGTRRPIVPVADEQDFQAKTLKQNNNNVFFGRF